jgi:hypothetical protein
MPMKNNARAALVLAILFLLSGCAERVPEPVLVPHDVPHISWNIHSGDAEDATPDVICQSDPRTACVVPASREGRKVLATVHMFYHPAATETKYAGTVDVGFFDEVHDMTPNSTVKPGAKPTHHTITDIVTSKPGTYPLRIAIVATSTQTGQDQNIRDEISVVVR